MRTWAQFEALSENQTRIKSTLELSSADESPVDKDFLTSSMERSTQSIKQI